MTRSLTNSTYVHVVQDVSSPASEEVWPAYSSSAASNSSSKTSKTLSAIRSLQSLVHSMPYFADTMSDRNQTKTILIVTRLCPFWYKPRVRIYYGSEVTAKIRWIYVFCTYWKIMRAPLRLIFALGRTHLYIYIYIQWTLFNWNMV